MTLIGTRPEAVLDINKKNPKFSKKIKKPTLCEQENTKIGIKIEIQELKHRHQVKEMGERGRMPDPVAST